MGRTNQRLGDRIKLHVPSVIRNKPGHHVNNQNDNADLAISSAVIQQLANTFCLLSLVLKPTQTVILEFFTNAVPPFN